MAIKRRKTEKTDPSEIVADIYLRESKVIKGQEKKKVSLDTQLKVCQDYIREMGWKEGEIRIDSNVSGFTIHYTKRKGLMELLERAKQGKCHKVVFYKYSRFGRKWFEEICDKFEDIGVAVISATERLDSTTPAGRAFRTNIAAFNRFYSEDLSEWFQDSKQRLAEKGRYNGGNGLYGANWNKNTHCFENDPVTSRVVLKLFELKAAGYGRSQCMKMLHDNPDIFGCSSPVCSSRGAEWWNETSIQYLWRNAKYIGLIQHNGLYYGGEHINEPIVLNGITYDSWFDYLIKEHEMTPEETHSNIERAKNRPRIIPNPIVPINLWNKVQINLVNDKKRSSAAKASRHEFAELIYDSRDGYSYQYKKQDAGHPARWICSVRKRRGTNACQSLLIDHDSFLQKILQTIFNLALNKELWATIKAEYEARYKQTIKPIQLDKKKLEIEIVRLEAALKKVNRSYYVDGTINEDEWLQLKNEYHSELTKMKSQYQSIEHPPELNHSIAAIENLKSGMEALQLAWEKLDTQERRLTLRNIIKKIIVYDTHVDVDFTFYKTSIKPSEVRRHVMYFF